ncbi:MAG: chlororespiratory reduction protein 7 [Acaryochloridaceae cyanobacterium CSU_3_4]|nr:chlororespiratory reduction protein 7 [Acaryochloridaceae cyanobacterium CSU_3_4]
MTNTLMYSDEDMYVVLEADQPEQFVTTAELLVKLESILLDLSQQSEQMPDDLQAIPTIPEQAKHLLATTCELDIGPSQFLQWYAVRLEK